MSGPGGSGPAPWSLLAERAPELAAAVRARFEANLHHVLGTIRPDGAPRLSGTEVAFRDGQVTLGMMPESRKLADVRRDARVELHSAPLEDDLATGDAKLAGRLVETGPVESGPGVAFRLDIELVSLVRVEGDELVFRVWRPSAGLREVRRS